MNSFFSFDFKQINYPIEFKQDECFTSNNDIVKSYEKFIINFNNVTYNYFVDFDFNNVVISGGIILGCLLNNFDNQSDIDLFLYDLSEDNMRKKIQEIINHFNKKNPINKVIETMNTVTIYFNYPYKPIQIILFKNNFKNECVEDFDLDICKVMYDGSNVLCDEKTFLSISNKAVLLNEVITLDYNKTYTRLLKYYNRGIKICIDGYDYDDMMIINSDFIDNLMFDKYHKTINNFYKTTIIQMEYDEFNSNAMDFYETKYKFTKYFDLSLINNDKLKNCNDLNFKIKNTIKHYIFDYLKNNNFTKKDEMKSILNIVNNKYETNSYGYLIKQSIIDKMVDICIEKNMLFFVLINNDDFIEMLYNRKNNNNINHISFMSKLYVYHYNDIDKINLINKLITNNNLINILHETVNFNQIIFSVYNNDTCKKLEIVKLDDNTLHFLMNDEKRKKTLNSNFIKSIVNDFINKEQIIIVLNNLVHDLILINIRYLYYKILDYFYKNGVDKNILELFLKYYEMIQSMILVDKLNNTIFNDININFNDKIFADLQGNNAIDFYINKKLTIYNIHMLNENNVFYFIENNFKVLHENNGNNEMMELIPYNIKTIILKALA